VRRVAAEKEQKTTKMRIETPVQSANSKASRIEQAMSYTIQPQNETEEANKRRNRNCRNTKFDLGAISYQEDIKESGTSVSWEQEP